MCVCMCVLEVIKASNVEGVSPPPTYCVLSNETKIQPCLFRKEEKYTLQFQFWKEDRAQIMLGREERQGSGGKGEMRGQECISGRGGEEEQVGETTAVHISTLPLFSLPYTEGRLYSTLNKLINSCCHVNIGGN